jgi:hypothetical protein
MESGVVRDGATDTIITARWRTTERPAFSTRSSQDWQSFTSVQRDGIRTGAMAGARF